MERERRRAGERQALFPQVYFIIFFLFLQQKKNEMFFLKKILNDSFSI